MRIVGMDIHRVAAEAVALLDGKLVKLGRIPMLRERLSDPVIRRLMTLPGVDMAVASGVAAAIGDVRRFEDPTKLVGYLGLSIRAPASPARDPCTMGGSPNRAEAKRAACSSKLHGQRPARLVHCGPSSSVWQRSGASRSPRSPLHASSP